ncbi:MAG: LolA-like putative outer membrane lipoprotein chaperone [Bacteroidaceae bacterium]
MTVLRQALALLLCLGLSETTYAQTDAYAVMDRAAEALRRDDGIRAEFNLQVVENGQAGASQAGNLLLQGEQFALQTDAASSWFDGQTLWSYAATSDEVYVSRPTADELQTVNPCLLLKHYRSSFSCRMGSRTTWKGQSVHEVVLTPRTADTGFESITLLLSRQTLRPLCIDLTQAGLTTRLTIATYLVRQHFEHSTFVFDPKRYPKAEVVDMR